MTLEELERVYKLRNSGRDAQADQATPTVNIFRWLPESIPQRGALSPEAVEALVEKAVSDPRRRDIVGHLGAIED